MLTNLAKSGFSAFPFALSLGLVSVSAFSVVGGTEFLKNSPKKLICNICADEWTLFSEGKRFYDSKNYTGAEGAWLKALKQRGSITNNDAVAMTTAHWLGYMYYQNGRMQEALPLLLLSVRLNQNINGIDHDDTQSALTHVAETYLALRNYEKSEQMFSDIYSNYFRRYGFEHASVSYVLNRLGMVYAHQERYQIAQEILSKNLSLCTRLYGHNSIPVAQAHLNLARMQRSNCQFDFARKNFQEATKISYEVTGCNSDFTALCLDEMGVLENLQGNFSQAGKLESKALAICQKNQKGTYTEAMILEDLAATRVEEGFLKEAESLLQNAILIRCKQEGKNSLEVAITKHMLAGVYYESKKYAQSEALLTEALSQAEAVTGKNNSVRMTFSLDKAKICRQSGRYKEAEKLLNEYLSYRFQKVRKADVYSAAAHYQLGLVYLETDKLDEAQTHLSSALGVRKQYFGKHARTAMSLDSMGHLNQKMGNYKRAREYFNQALAMRKEVLGAVHPDSIESENDLAALSNLYKARL